MGWHILEYHVQAFRESLGWLPRGYDASNGCLLFVPTNLASASSENNETRVAPPAIQLSELTKGLQLTSLLPILPS